jgi:hypothetical protein
MLPIDLLKYSAAGSRKFQFHKTSVAGFLFLFD